MERKDALAQVIAAAQALPPGLREHVQRVREIAVALAMRHGLDPQQADLAAAAHDLARAMRDHDLLSQAREASLTLGPVEEALPVLLHGPLAAYWLRRRYGITASPVLEAVAWHTTARQGLSPLAKLVFLADKLDPEKAVRYPFLGRVRDLAQEDLEAALLEFLTQDLQALLQQGLLVHPAGVEARNELLLRRQRASPRRQRS